MERVQPHSMQIQHLASPHPPQTPLDIDGIPGCHLTLTKKALEILPPGPPPPKT